MRIWEQGLVATFSLPGYKALILEHYAAYQRPGTTIEVHGVRDDTSPAAAKIAGSAVKYSYLHRFHDTQIIENCRRAEREGFDAVMIGVLQDPGLKEARSVVDIPVIGYGEVSMLTACMHGTKFAFIGINPEKKGGGRIYIDPEGEKLSDGRIRAKKVSAIDVIRKYG